jgi:hypothetical protein
VRMDATHRWKPAPQHVPIFSTMNYFRGASFLGNHAMIVGFNRPNNRRDIESWEKN